MKSKIVTNADRIRNMTDKELLDWLNDLLDGNCHKVCDKENYCKYRQCKDGISDWLQEIIR